MENLVHIAKKITAACVLALSMTQIASAADWSHYGNARFGYWVDVPPGFSKIVEAGNSDGGTSTSADGRAELSAWGAYIMEDSFADEVASRIDDDKQEGWIVSYDKRAAKAASWSGTKGDRVFYERTVVGCDGAAAYFRIEYDRSAIKAYDKIVARLARSLYGCGR
jgi:hypothetical protein